MITETKITPVEFNGLLFEINHKCIVYKKDDLTYFVSQEKLNDLDTLIMDNVTKSKESE